MRIIIIKYFGSPERGMGDCTPAKEQRAGAETELMVKTELMELEEAGWAVRHMGALDERAIPQAATWSCFCTGPPTAELGQSPPSPSEREAATALPHPLTPPDLQTHLLCHLR